jgi:hypothetical protein
VADFHSLRGYFVSALVRAGSSIKTVQILARHATSQAILTHYAKVSVRDLRGSVESLPTPAATDPEPLAATGTDPVTPVCHNLAAHGQRAGDGDGWEPADAGGMVESAAVMLRNTDMPEPSLDDGFGRVLSVPAGWSGEGGIRTPETS